MSDCVRVVRRVSEWVVIDNLGERYQVCRECGTFPIIGSYYCRFCLMGINFCWMGIKGKIKVSNTFAFVETCIGLSHLPLLIILEIYDALEVNEFTMYETWKVGALIKNTLKR